MSRLNNSPYPGLRPFREDEADLFFGREQKIEEMLAKLEQHRFLAVIGTSGCGKSSLVGAGLLPALREGFLSGAERNWRMAIMRPGESPYDRLTDKLLCESALAPERGTGPRAAGILQAALRRGPLGLVEAVKESHLPDNTSFLLVVDQFEEIFRYRRQSRHPEDADAFVRLMLTSADSQLSARVLGNRIAIFVILTMRSDYFGDCAIFAGLPEAINSGLFLTPRLNRAEYETAIAEPARVAGGSIAPSLANRLLNDVRAEPDQLPVLQHALMRMWLKAVEGSGSPSDPAAPEGAAPVELTLDDYKKVGGLSEALSKHADEALAELEPRQVRLAEVMFRCLCERGSDGRETRRPAMMRDIAAVADVPWEDLKPVAECFRRPDRSFIMPAVPAPLEADTFLDISHESLIRQWHTLNAWVKSETEFAEIYQRLAGAASRWKEGRGEPWRKTDLYLALEWKKKAKPTAAWAAQYGGDFDLAMEFLDHSRQESEKEARAEGDRLREKLRRTRQLAAAQAKAVRLSRVIAIVSIVAFFVALSLAVFAWVRTEEAAALREYDYAREVAERSKQEASGKPRLGILLAAEALRVIRESEGRAGSSIIFSVIRFLDLRVRALFKMNVEPTKVVEDVLPDATDSVRRALHNLEQLPLLDFGQSHKSAITSIAINKDGTRIASGSLDGVLKLWDADTLSEIDSFDAHKDESPSKKIRYGINMVVFSPDGKLIATAAKDHTTSIFEYDRIPVSESLNRSYTIKYENEVQTVAFSADNKFVATAGRDGATILYDVDAKQKHRLGDHTQDGTATIFTFAFSPNGKHLAIVSKDKTICRIPAAVEIWNTENHNRVKTLRSEYGAVYTVAYSTDGKFLACGAEEGIQVYDSEFKKDEKPKYKRVCKGKTDEKISILAFHPMRPRLAAAAGRKIRLWEIDQTPSGKIRLRQIKSKGGSWRFRHSDRITTLAFSPNGERLVSASRDGKIKIWNVTGLFATLKGHRYGVSSAVFSPDGQRLVSAGRDGGIRVWDATRSEELPILVGHTDAVRAVAFVNSDGTRLATASDDGSARIWETNTETDSTMKPKTHDGLTKRAAIYQFSLDGSHLAVAGRDGRVNVWITESGEEVWTFQAHTNRVTALAFNIDGSRLAAAGTDQTGTASDYTVKVWDVATGKLVREFSGHSGQIDGIALDSEGIRLATAGWDMNARVWNIETGELLSTASGHNSRLHAVSFSPDGKHLATGSSDRTARIWKIKKEKAVLKTILEGHAKRIIDVAFSPDGTQLATAGDDDTAMLWDVKSGRPISTFQASANNVYEVAFSPDGQRLATSWDDGTIRLYLSKPPELRQKGLARIDKPLNLKDCESLHPLELRSCKPFLRIGTAKRLVAEGEAGRAEAVKEFRKVLSETTLAEAVIDSKALLEGLDLDTALAGDPETAAQTWLINELKSLAGRQAVSGDVQGLTASLESLKDLDPDYSSAKLKKKAARVFERRALRLAQRGNLEEVEANYQQAFKLNPSLKYNPRDKARQEIAKVLIYKTDDFLRQYKVEDALANLAEAKKVDPGVEISNRTWADLCWKGVLQDQADKVLDACEQAVKNAPENGGMRDSRGVAKAMTGNLESVIEDFEAYVEWAPGQKRPQSRIDRRKRWIEQLNNDQNPFSGPNREKVLEELRAE